MDIAWWILVLIGTGVGMGAAFTGLGGGFLIVPALLYFGFTGSKAVGTSLGAIFIIAISSIFAHQRMGNIDIRTALFIGLGGLLGAQVGAHLVSQVSSDVFRRIFAAILALLAVYLVVKK